MSRLVTYLALLLVAFASGFIPAASGSPDGESPALDEIRQAVAEGRAEEAVSAVEVLHKNGEKSAESYYLLGLANQIRLDEVGLLGKRRVAAKLRAALENALAFDHRHIGAREELADFYHYAPAIVGGSEAKAEEQIGILEGFSPHDAHRVRGRHAYSSEEYRAAEDHFTRALELDDSDPAVWYQRANSRMKLKEKDSQALADYEHVLALGYDKPDSYYQIGRLCVRLGTCAERGEQALLHFIGRAEGREQAIGRYRLAQLYEQIDRLPEARAEAHAALTLEPEIPDIQALLERVEEKMALSLPGSG